MSFPRSHFTDKFDADSAGDNFPFNRNANRDDYFKSTLDNLAKRHPELAEHFQDINHRPRSRSRPAEELKNRFRRPFGDKFPFDDDDDFDIDPAQYTQHFYPQEFYQPDSRHPQTSSYQETPRENKSSSAYPQAAQSEATPPRPPPQTETTTHPPQEPRTQEKERPGLQQSNTVDLGQRQEPIDDRNQRSMSAPPGGESKKRYTSSINIPINTTSENMSQNQQPEQKSNERIIPIQVEGMDVPVFPKNPNIPPPQSHPMQDRFSHRPEPFPRGFQDEHFSRQNIPHNFQQYHPSQPPQYYQHPKDDIPIHVQRENFDRKQQPQQQPTPQQQQHPTHQQQHPQQSQQQHHHQQQSQQHHQAPQPFQQQQQPEPQAAEQEEAKPASQERKPLTPIEQIQEIQKDVSSLMEQVEKFTGKPRDKQYLYLDEMLTRNLIKLDNIDTQGQDTIRQARKEAIKCIQQAIALLESKASAEEKMEIDQKPQTAAVETKEDNPDKNDISDEQKSAEANKIMEVSENSQKEETQPAQADQLPVNPNSESENNAATRQETEAVASEVAVAIGDKESKEQKHSNKENEDKKGKKT